MCLFRKLSNNKVRNNRLNNIIHFKNVLFGAHGFKLQHSMTPYKNNASSMNFY
jgi:hypothetical protein